MCVWLTKPYTDKLDIVICRYPKNLYLEDVEVELKSSEYQKFLSKRECLLRYIDIFFKGCTILDETTILNRSVFRQEVDALILVSIIRFHPKVKTKIYTIVLEKTSASASVTVQTSQFRYDTWTKNFCSVERFVLEIRTWTLFSVTPRSSGYMQYSLMLLEQFDYKLVKDLATFTWLNEDPIRVCLATLLV